MTTVDTTDLPTGFSHVACVEPAPCYVCGAVFSEEEDVPELFTSLDEATTALTACEWYVTSQGVICDCCNRARFCRTYGHTYEQCWLCSLHGLETRMCGLCGTHSPDTARVDHTSRYEREIG
ncbi:hypothetical protein [Amycolatopsis sp. NPDC051903]|uniref:hypothetical protein n=1 Tax=Amycolatopsis sp. NPDC051903 TaxID=3363936 RepID=UPI00379B9321